MLQAVVRPQKGDIALFDTGTGAQPRLQRIKKRCVPFFRCRSVVVDLLP
jgi:hypothetical protein